MPKKCIICGAEAKYCIKGTSDYYCDECAEENFADITLLQKVEDKEKEDVKACAADEDLPEDESEDSQEDKAGQAEEDSEQEEDSEGDFEDEPEEDSEQEEE